MRPDAARQSIREVGLACWLTSLTTAIGFGSLVLAHHEIVREFGYCCVIGVLMTFISVITIIPLACASPLGRRVHSGYGRNLVDKNLSRISVIIDFVLRPVRAVQHRRHRDHLDPGVHDVATDVPTND